MSVEFLLLVQYLFLSIRSLDVYNMNSSLLQFPVVYPLLINEFVQYIFGFVFYIMILSILLYL